MSNWITIVKKNYAAALLISCCFVCSCENSQEEIDALTKNKVMQDEAITVESYISQEGKMKAKLKAPLMTRVMADTLYIEFPKSLHVDFYNDSTKIDTWLDAKYAKYFESFNKVYLRDSVVVITAGGDTLRCHDLWWDQNKGMFYTDSVATYRSPDTDIRAGKGMEATQDLKMIKFKYPTGPVNINNSGFAEQ